MSGLEPLVALSLACNILQLVETGHETIELIKTVYRGGSLDDALEHNATILWDISQEIKTCKRPAKCPKHEQQLLLAAEKCATAARDLKEEVIFLVGNARQGNLASTLKVVVKVNWRKRRVERLKEVLDNAEKSMHTGLLARIWSSSSAAELDVKDLKEDLRSFIVRFQNGHRSTEDLVSREGLETRKHVSSASAETMKSLGRVHQSLDSLVLDKDFRGSQAKRDRLLESLKFPGFNERRSQVDNKSYEDTGEWIFSGDGDADSDSDSDGDGDGHSDGDSDGVSDGGTDDHDDAINRNEDFEAFDSVSTSSDSSDWHQATHNRHGDPSDVEWDSFSNWLRSTDPFYWISGKPGSGKSTLVSFILKSPKTKSLLEIWQPNVLIISHFFWRPGTTLQQSIKGLLCSLLYQLLQYSTADIDLVLSSIALSGTKDDNTDWSEAELLPLCLQVLSAYYRPVCIFLDGLDEVDPKDGVPRLLNVVNRLSQGKAVKICSSSRPEPLLQRRLSIYPKLRLQDLNRRDLLLYARDHVQFPDESVVDDEVWDAIDLLVDKAEGVFLWLVLATNSVNRGAELGDSMQTLLERIDQLPGDLIDLYKDMWQRTADNDPHSYRQTAAIYFKLLLTYSKWRALWSDMGLLFLVLASTLTADEILQSGIEAPSRIPEDVLVQRCRQVEAKLNACCFGLIELGPSDWPRAVRTPIGHYGSRYDALLPFTGHEKVLRFMHRTAHDFLVDTAEGKEILAFDKSSDFSLKTRLLKAYLARSQLFLHDREFSNLLAGSYFGGSFVVVPLLILRQIRHVHHHRDDWNAEAWNKLQYHCEALANAGKYFVGSSDRACQCRNDDFLKVLAKICGDQRILLAIKEGKLSKDTKSEILLNACDPLLDGFCLSSTDTTDEFVEESRRMLLRKGADPNYRGVVFSPQLWRWPYAQLETPFMKYLEDALMLATQRRFTSEELSSVLETIRLFIYHKANLDEMVTLFYCIDDKDSADTIIKLDIPRPCPIVQLIKPGIPRPCPVVQLSWTGGPPNYFFVSREEDQDGNIFNLFIEIPGHIILDILLCTIRDEYVPPAEEQQFREHISSIETGLANWDRRGSARLLGKVCYDEFSTVGWFETATEHEEWIANELLCATRENVQKLKDGRFRPKNEKGLERLLSLCAQAPWTSKASGKPAIWERFEELGIFTRVDQSYEVHSIQEWGKRQQAEYLQVNDKSREAD